MSGTTATYFLTADTDLLTWLRSGALVCVHPAPWALQRKMGVSLQLTPKERRQRVYRNPLPGRSVSSCAFSDLFHPPVPAVRTQRDLFCAAGYNPMLLEFLALNCPALATRALSVGSRVPVTCSCHSVCVCVSHFLIYFLAQRIFFLIPNF